MNRKRYTDERIAYCLRQAAAGTPVTEICRKISVSQETFHTWRRKFADMGVAELRGLSLDKHILQEVITRKLQSPHADASSWSGSGRCFRSASVGRVGSLG